MANLVTDSNGKPSPQYLSEDGSRYEYQQGKNGALNVNIKGFDGTALPTQIIDQQGNIISKFYDVKEKRNITVLPLLSRTGEQSSSEITINNNDNVTLIINKTIGDNPITSLTVEGQYDNTFLPIYTVENISPDVNVPTILNIGINSNEHNMVLPLKIKVKVNTAESTTYAVYLTTM